jgi:1-carboxybiuret hydrolase subunit AtzG-like protein
VHLTDEAAMPEDLERQVEILASVVGLSITDAERPGVVRFFRLARAMADKVYGVPLADDTFEVPAVFLPGMSGREQT